MGEQLRGWGVVVDEAADGAAALERLRAARRERRYDAVLLDVQLPGMDGLELARAIGADPALAAIPLLMLSLAGAGRRSAAAARAPASRRT